MRTTRTNFDNDTASTTSVTTTTSLPIIFEEQSPPSSPDNTDDGPLNLSQETLSEHFRDPESQTFHAQHHVCEIQPMGTLVTAGSN